MLSLVKTNLGLTFSRLLLDKRKAYWTAGSYMGETTGAFFSYAVEFSLDYHVRNPRYQPFSVYEDYPGALRENNALPLTPPPAPCLLAHCISTRGMETPPARTK